MIGSPVPGMEVPLTRTEQMTRSAPSLAGKLRPGRLQFTPLASNGSLQRSGGAEIGYLGMEPIQVVGSPRVRHTAGLGVMGMLKSKSELGISRTMQAMRQEHREDHAKSRSRLLSKVAPPLSRFNGEDEEMRMLSRTLQRSAKERAATKLALEAIDRDYDMEFPPTHGARYPVGQLVHRSAVLSNKLEATCRSLEAAAAASLAASQQGAIEREAFIRSLQAELERGEEEMMREILAAQYNLHRGNNLLRHQASAVERALLVDLQRAEDLIIQRDDTIAELSMLKEQEEERFAQTEEEKRRKLIEHLRHVAVRRLMKGDLSRGWTSWVAHSQYYIQLKRKAAGRFRDAARHAALRKWVFHYPPKGSIRRIVEPLEAQIRDLDRALLQVRKVNEKLREDLKEKERKLGLIDGTLGKEREMRVAHLMRIAMQRIMSLELSRGWGKWHGEANRARELKKRAGARFVKRELWKGFYAWKLRYPPQKRSNDLERQLEREKKAHQATKAMLAERTRERDLAREHARETTRLQMIVRELQRVLAEAMMANSWVGCRQILYHESLRYVPTAATHGKMLPRAVRKEIMRANPEQVSGRMVSGDLIDGMLRDGQEQVEEQQWAGDMRIPAGFTPGSIAQFDDFIAQNMRDSTEADADQSDLDTALGKPRVMTTAMMKAMLEETEHNAKIRIAQQEAEEKRKLARTELELKADTQVQMMANEKYKRVSRELELSPRSPNLYAVQNLNQSTTSQ